ncbi:MULTISPECIES: cupin domain-containing protein [Aquimarina]|uniref:Cupin domain-containing protein n=1 Tax=Aquimarina algiphila TaxID=2047982 RepID=A0A554VF78_9FLAO|nr:MULTISPECIES: cupin domain-containing protein [Aquimarina]TSE05779.1 cupin domain-containing protein [Aquimarina algiphila]
MHLTSLLKDVTYGEKKPILTKLIENDATKEIRIVFKKGQEMKEHKTKFPITVEVFEGEIGFGANNITYVLKRGDIISLDPNVSHNLIAAENSIIRLSLSMKDTVERVQKVNL